MHCTGDYGWARGESSASESPTVKLPSLSHVTGLNVFVITNCRHEAGANDEEAMFYNLDEIF